jgi:hypothetical protein
VTGPEFLAILSELAGDDTSWHAATLATVNGWLARGDGVAVYRNVDLGSRDLGARQLVSYGSPAAQLEVTDPPTRLPDIGGAINWRFQLEGTYRGAMLAEVTDHAS